MRWQHGSIRRLCMGVPGLFVVSCGTLPLAAQEGRNDDHRPSPFGARHMYERIVGIVTVHFSWRSARFRIKQTSDGPCPARRTPFAREPV